MKAVHAVFYMMAQLFGGFCGSLLVRAMTSETQFHAIDGGTTTVGNAFMWYQGLIAEVMMTFLLTQTVVLTAVDTCSNTLAPFAIGSALVIDILAVGTVSGASMNPARSFGPALAASMFGIGEPLEFIWRNHYIYWAGPFIGAVITALLYK
uniref:Aquaporin n=1 Tax=Ascaris lumbricoides TaxID=6252 RepID=A0A0M3IGJ6_ASCLU